MSAITTVVLSASDFGTKVEYHQKRKALVAEGYTVSVSTKNTVTLVKEASAPVSSRRSSTPSRRRAPSVTRTAPAPAPAPAAAPAPVVAVPVPAKRGFYPYPKKSPCPCSCSRCCPRS